MDIHKLQHFIKASNEDFADAHEPVNDGVKKVPNADDIASQVGRSGSEGGESTDITSQGEATIIEEKPDDEDTGTEMTEQVTTDTDANDLVEETETVETETPVEDEPELAHDDVKAVETDEKVTAKEKESLEAFVPLVKRAELIGYSKRQTEDLTRSIRTIRGKAGLRGPVTVSAESIQETIILAETHLVKLARKRKYLAHQVSLENVAPIVNPMNEEPLAHAGAAPLSVNQGLAITEQEMLPMIDTVIEEQAMAETQQNIEQLQQAGIAIEKYIELVRDNKGKVSKQTAAIIRTGLEHIDQVCSLRPRSTGLENYDTTPRSAMESIELDEKSLTSRAKEIGAAILKQLKILWEKGKELWDRLMHGGQKLDIELDQILETLKGKKGNAKERYIELSGVVPQMFDNGNFCGAGVSNSETESYNKLANTATYIKRAGIHPIAAALSNGNAGPFDRILDELNNNGGGTIVLPGGGKYVSKGITIEYERPDGSEDVPSDPYKYELPELAHLRHGTTLIKRHLNSLINGKIINVLEGNLEEIKNAIVKYRDKVKGDESELQSIQTTVIDNLITPYTPGHYSELIKPLLVLVRVKIPVLKKLVDQYE